MFGHKGFDNKGMRRGANGSSGQFVSEHVFVPVTDELIFDTPELIEGPLVPYSSGMACHGWLSIELNPSDDPQKNSNQRHRSPSITRDKRSRGDSLLQKVGLRSANSDASKPSRKSISGDGKKAGRHLKLVFGG